MADDACGVAPVLGAVRRVEFIVDVVAGVGEGDVFADAPGLDVAFVPLLGAAEPGGTGPVDGSDIEAIAVADDPDRSRAPSVPSRRSEAICSSSAAPILVSSSLVQVVMASAPEFE